MCQGVGLEGEINIRAEIESCFVQGVSEAGFLARFFLCQEIKVC